MFNFDTEVCFGTAGVRGLIGKDINIPIVKRITQGLSNYIKKQNITQPKVVIGYDCRRMSKEFAEAVALILNANGIATYSFNKVTPAPMISFAVRALMCISGIMITASHNSKEYNGYKIYWQDGGQIISPIDKEIEYEINKIKDSSMILTTHRQWSIDSNLYYLLNDKIDEVYVNELCKSILQPEIIKEMQEEIRVVYTPLHGTGAELIDKTLSHLGIMNLFFVEQQLNPNGKFPTIPNPNPEDPKAFILGLQLAKKVKADIIIANDPDADRIGLYVKHKNDYIRFTGDMIGALLLEYQLSIKQELKILPKNGIIIKSIVCSNLIDEIAKAYNTSVKEVLIGFKYISEQIKIYEQEKIHSFLFGYEESFGYLTGTTVRDKDGILAAALICEALAYYKKQSKTLYDQYLHICNKYGYYQEDSFSIMLNDASPILKKQLINEKKIVEELNKINKYNIHFIKDLSNGIEHNYLLNNETTINLPKTQGLYCDLGDKWFCFRFSGTEPKIKIYLGVKGQSIQDAENKVNSFKKDLQEIIVNIEEV